MLKVPSLFLITLVLAVYGDGPSKSSGISQFWTDDYKVFDQIYGRTSDKDLYGITLPPTIRFDIGSPKLAASDKHERYLSNIHDLSSPELSEDRYAKMFAKSLYNDKDKGSSALQFISFSDFKPISATSDPETYNYLKHLENDEKYKTSFPTKAFDSYTPYKQIEADVEAKDAYKSIQDILDAHEANKGKHKDMDENGLKEKRKNKNNYGVSKNRNKVRSLNGNGLKSPCSTGRCRNRLRNSVHVNNRPYVRAIHYRYDRR